MSGLDEHVKTILRYHLSFDFAFMAGAYPGIAALCMMAREKTGSSILKKILVVLAALQLAAWYFDITENLYHLRWVKTSTIENNFGQFHFIAVCKWIISIMGAFIAIPFVLKHKKVIVTNRAI